MCIRDRFIAATKHKVNHNGLEYWVPRHGGNPFTAYNPTDEVVSVGPIRFVPGVVVVHPGPLREYVVDRLIVPDAGLYAVTGGFAGADTRGALTDVYVVLDGSTIFSGVVDGFGSASRVSFSFTQYLPAGATLDFMVGTNGVDYLQDATTVSARITAVPEPATLPMLAGGLAVLALAARRGRCSIGTSDA